MICLRSSSAVIVLILLLFAAYSFSKADPKQAARVLRPTLSTRTANNGIRKIIDELCSGAGELGLRSIPAFIR